MGNEALRGIIKQTPEWGGIPMKKWIWAVLIFLVAGVVGGYSVAHYPENELQYQRNITNGIERGVGFLCVKCAVRLAA